MNSSFSSLLRCAVAVVLTSLSVYGQSATPKPFPAPPFLAVIPESSEWTRSIEIAPKTQKEPVGQFPGTVLSEEVVKSPVGRYDSAKLASGALRQKWWLDGFTVSKSSDSDFLNIRVLVKDPTKNWLQSYDLPEVKWIDTAKPKTWTTFQGRECLLFEAEVPDMAFVTDDMVNGSENVPSIHVRAWVDSDTKLPIGYHDGRLMYLYHFKLNTSSGFSVPEEVNARIQRYIKRSKAAY